MWVCSTTLARALPAWMRAWMKKAVVQAVPRGRPERRRQVDPCLGYGVIGQHRKISIVDRRRASR